MCSKILAVVTSGRYDGNLNWKGKKWFNLYHINDVSYISGNTYIVFLSKLLIIVDYNLRRQSFQTVSVSRLQKFDFAYG